MSVEADVAEAPPAALAMSREHVIRLSGLSARQVDYWASTGLIGPSVDRSLAPGRRVRLYEFREVLELLIATELRRRRISVQQIRQIVDHLRRRGYERPLTELPFAVLGNNVYFQHEDGSWEGDLRPDQIVIHEVLNLEPLRHRISEAVDREGSDVGRVERRRGTLGGKPVVAGTRVPVATVQRYLERGRTVAEIVESFPALRPADVEAIRNSAA